MMQSRFHEAENGLETTVNKLRSESAASQKLLEDERRTRDEETARANRLDGELSLVRDRINVSMEKDARDIAIRKLKDQVDDALKVRDEETSRASRLQEELSGLLLSKEEESSAVRHERKSLTGSRD